MIQSYKQKYKLNEPYDCILIGSGLGCMTTAAILSKQGSKVLLLERHYTAGGYTHIFKRKGYEWDVGIHYIGEMGKDGFNKKLFDYVSDGQIKWVDMGEVYDRIIIGNKTYDYVTGRENLKNKLKEYFPKEIKTIDQYFELVYSVVKSNKYFFMDKALPSIFSHLFGWYLRKNFLKYSNKTTLEVLESITENKELIKVLTAQYGDYGLPPAQSSFAIHATLTKHFFSGGFFPKGGASVIAESIEKVIASNGGTILTNAEVDQVIVENNCAVGVRMKDGKEFLSKSIVSGTGIINTYKKLIPEKVASRFGFNLNLKNVSPSVSHVCLYIGLNGTPKELNLPKANYWIYPQDGTHDECVDRFVKDTSNEFPVVYISFPSAKDPDWTNRYPGKSTIDIITLMPYEIFEKWEGTSWKKRGDEYEKLKEIFAKRLLAELYKKEPQLKDKVNYYELSTPLTTRNFVNYERGEIYGINHNPQRFKQKFLKPKTSIKNFYLTGQDIVTVGIVGALASGLVTASAITGKNLFKKILK